MTPGQWEILSRFADEQTWELVRGRLLHGLKLFDGNTPNYPRPVIKLVVLLVRVANPKEFLTENENALVEAGMRQIQNGTEKPQSAARSRKKTARKPKRQKPGL